MSKLEQPADGGSPGMTCSALVTRYPTGIFGIAFAGCMFWKTCSKESEVHAELAAIKIPKRHVKWEERYYDRRFDFNDPRSYKTRKFIPQNVDVDATAGEKTQPKKSNV